MTEERTEETQITGGGALLKALFALILALIVAVCKWILFY